MRKIFTKIYSTYKVRVHSFNIVKIFHIVRVGTYIRNLHSLIFKQFLCTAFYVYVKQVLKPYTSAGILVTYLQVYCTYYIGFRLIIRRFCLQSEINRSNQLSLINTFSRILKLQHLWTVLFQSEQVSHIWSPAHIHLAEQVVIACFLNKVMNVPFDR